MKIYTQDHGVYGHIVVVASDETGARELMKSCRNYDPDQDVWGFAILKGLVIENLGDS